MRLEDDACDPEVEIEADEPVDAEAMAAALSARISELDAVAWNLPRPVPEPFPLDEAWPSADDAA